jgi:hypothetical protein
VARARADADTSPQPGTPEHRMAGHHLPEHHAQRVDVRADVHANATVLHWLDRDRYYACLSCLAVEWVG